ncbi:MAG: Ig-like domain-containing protein [Patescibacteria group bacterium]|jgi:hypothetical protein
MHTPITWNKPSLKWLLIILSCFLLIPGLVLAAENHPPIINSTPGTEVTTDHQYQYTADTTDTDNETLTYALTTAPQGMTIAGNVISWQPFKAGVYNVVLEVTDQNNGYDTQAWQIQVKPGAVATITVDPYDKPYKVNVGASQQFTAQAFDQYGNEITGVDFEWSTNPDYGTVTNNGLLTGNKAGTSYVAAKANSIKKSVGLAIEGGSNPVSNTNQASNANTAAATNQNTNKSSNANSQSQNTNANENTNESLTNGNINENTNENASEQENKACSNWPHWLLIVLPIIYALALIVYYQFEKKNKSGSWWIFPVLLTAIGLIIFYKYICPDTYVWWPWVLVIIGAVLTLLYKGKAGPDNGGNKSQTELPF